MTIAARFAGLFRLLTASDYPAPVRSYQRASGATSGPAPIIVTMPSGDGLAQLQAQRLRLLAEAERQRHLRRSKEASTYERELRAVTHQILSTRTSRHA